MADPPEEGPEKKPSGKKLERTSSRVLPKREPGEKPHLPGCYLCKQEFGSQRQALNPKLSIFTLQLAILGYHYLLIMF